MLTLRDEQNAPKYWAEDVSDYLRADGHAMFKTDNMSGFLSFLFYIAFITSFVALGFCMAANCCPAFEPDQEAKDIAEELERIAKEDASKKSGLEDSEEKIRKSMKHVIESNTNTEAAEQFGEMTYEEQKKEIKKLVEKFEKKDDLYHKYIGRKFYFAFSCGIIGFFLSYYVFVTALRNLIVVTNDPEWALTKLEAFIPEDVRFEANDHARPILTGYDFDYSQPLNFLYGNSDDLKLKVGD